MTRAESDAVLEALWAHVTQPQFVYEHHWRLGDLVMWDNRSTMHRRDPFDGEARRVMHRTQIKGSTPAGRLRGSSLPDLHQHPAGGWSTSPDPCRPLSASRRW